MMSFSLNWMYGVSVGLLFFDDEDKEIAGVDWGVVLQLFILQIVITKFTMEE